MPLNDRLLYKRAGGALILILLVAFTWGVQNWHVAQVRSTAESRQRESVAGAAETIRSDFSEMVAELHAEARAIAETRVVRMSLRRYVQEDRSRAPQALIEYFEALSLREYVTAEVYDPTPRLVAWKGIEMPLGSALIDPVFLQAPQAAIVQDQDRRFVLAIWRPVRVGSDVVGGVRVLRLLRYDSPVENQYLGDYSISERWSRVTGLSIQVRLDEVAASEQAVDLSLTTVRGDPLAKVAITPPGIEEIVQATADRYRAVMAFWVILLLAWLAAAMWKWYYRLYRDEEAGIWLLRRGAVRFAGCALVLWAARFVMLELNIPAEWQTPGGILEPLFDPRHLASTVGGGLLRSIGDLFISGVFAVGTGVALLSFASRFRRRGFLWYSGRAAIVRPTHASIPRFVTVGFGLGVFLLALFMLLTVSARRVVLDSTIDYFARGDLVPGPLVLVIYASLLLVALAVATLAIAGTWLAFWMLIRYRPSRPRVLAAGLALAAVVTPALLLYLFTSMGAVAPWGAAAVFFGVTLSLAVMSFTQPAQPYQLLAMRNVLMGLFLLTILLYPLLFTGMDAQRRVRMSYATGTFAEGEDPRVVYAISQVLEEAHDRLDGADGSLASIAASDSLAENLLSGSLLSSLNLYQVSVTLLDAGGTPVGRAQQPMPGLDRSQLDDIESMEFMVLRNMYRERAGSGPLVEQITGRQERERFQYAGIMPIYPAEDTSAAAHSWAMVRAEPQMLLRESRMPFPRVLLPAGIYGVLYADLSLAEFSDGILVRSLGRDFGRYRLDQQTQQLLYAEPHVWLKDELGGRTFLTYYERKQTLRSREGPSHGPVSSYSNIVAARTPAINTFDHLYYLLRLTVAGLFLALPLYLLGLYARRRAGELPAPQVPFRNKVLNAFLAVGIVTVLAVGLVGLNVVQEENERTTQRWLREQLERIEESLALEAEGGEMPYQVLARIRTDRLSQQVGLPVNLYSGHRLVASSRPQLIRQRLIDERLPVAVYRDLYYNGYRFTYAQEMVGDFQYTTGFRTLLDESGEPRYVVGVPTLPEQERIKDERARTVAYLFGALLLLMLVVMLTASVIANALARPIARLREGLQAVARGSFERRIPVSTRDEIGELVATFNTTQDQLEESRRRLAQQERQLAWREMARQVAHEIKNPLTPMKLSVQHMRKGWQKMLQVRTEQDEEEAQFDALFDRITSTLIEQIDALARIANEFHSFARMPTSAPEMVDINAVVEQAVALMREEEGDVDISLEVDETPLRLQADRQELRRLFINLIKNAIQSVPEGVTGKILIASELETGDDGQARASTMISDNGIGIPEELREKIFQPNFSTKTSGTGLGLAIAAKSVEDLGGSIEFDTREGEGTTFRIRLPIAES